MTCGLYINKCFHSQVASIIISSVSVTILLFWNFKDFNKEIWFSRIFFSFFILKDELSCYFHALMGCDAQHLNSKIFYPLSPWHLWLIFTIVISKIIWLFIKKQSIWNDNVQNCQMLLLKKMYNKGWQWELMWWKWCYEIDSE